MIDYPSIPRAIGNAFREIPNAYIFDKLDGTSARSEWNRKRGWYKHGLRHTRVDANNPLSFFAEIPNRWSRADEDLWDLAARTLNIVLDGKVEQNRVPHRRWG